ncbi:MAG TPA: YccF domain-containing protein [Actinocrinis sp.]|nr:YccF domain-containing protein [Actinocrinis sp.]
MRTLLNVVWLILCGLWMAIGYAIVGLVCFVTIIGIPFGFACWRIADYVLWPFGRTIVGRRSAGVGSCLGNGVWIILAGLWLALAHLATGIALCCTIIGIPLGLASFKIIPITLTPLGVEIIPSDARYPTATYYQA